MVRFIFVCMGVVALSFIAIAFQSATDGIMNEQQDIAARNFQEEQETIAVIEQPDSNTAAENLNQIEAAAGAGMGNDDFGSAFTNAAPTALQEETASETMPEAAIVPEADSLN